MNILFLSRWFPYPTSNGSKLRIYNLLRGLAEHHAVTVISFFDPTDGPPDIAHLCTFCHHVQCIPWKPYSPNSQQARLGFFSKMPRFLVDTFSPELQYRVTEAAAATKFDRVIATQLDMTVYTAELPGLPAIFEEAEVGVLYENYTKATSLTRRLRSGLTWLKHRRYLASLGQNFQLFTVVSERERTLLAHALGQARSKQPPIAVVPNGVDVANYQPFITQPEPNHLIFTGAFSYEPNYEAMQWFIGETLPLIQKALPNTRLTITGDHQNKLLPPARHVTATGFVQDVRPLIAGAWASVVPLHTGGGTRLKILEAMALQTPVIATTKGAEGLDATPGKHLLIADTPQTFAYAAIQLLREPSLRQELATNAYQLICKRYDWRVIMPHFLDVVEHLVYTD